MAAVSARVDLDEAADERARAFIHERLPPMLPPGPADPRQLADPALDVEEALAAEREAARRALKNSAREPWAIAAACRFGGKTCSESTPCTGHGHALCPAAERERARERAGAGE